MGDHVCSTCGEIKDLSKARFVHVRIGLDEPPKPVVCKCKDPIEIFNMAANKYAATKAIEAKGMDSYMDKEVPRIWADSESTLPCRCWPWSWTNPSTRSSC